MAAWKKQEDGLPSYTSTLEEAVQIYNKIYNQNSSSDFK